MIPEQGELIHEGEKNTMSSYPVGTKIRIARVLDERELLDYLVSIQLNIHEEYEIIDAAAYEGPITIKNDTKEIAVSYKAASTIFVDKL